MNFASLRGGCAGLQGGLLLLGTLLSLASLQAQTPGTQNEVIYTTGDLERYLIYVPAAVANEPTKKWPLLLFLHGVGTRADSGDPAVDLADLRTKDIPSQIDYALANGNPSRWDEFIVISPQTSGGWDAGHLNSLVDNIIANYPVDEERLIVTGQSMGGGGTYETLLDAPSKWAAGAPIAGFDYSGNNDVDKLKNIPLWIAHGTNDGTVPYASSENTYNAIKAAIGGAESTDSGTVSGSIYPDADDYSYDYTTQTTGICKFTTYQGASHNTWTPTYERDDVRDWMLEQSLPGANSAPGLSLDGPDLSSGLVDLGETGPLTVSASDPDGSIAVIRVELNGQLINRVEGSNSLTIPDFFKDLFPGNYTIRLSAIDNDGRETVSLIPFSLAVAEVRIDFDQLVKTGINPGAAGANLCWLTDSDKLNPIFAAEGKTRRNIQDAYADLGLKSLRFPYGHLSDNYLWHTGDFSTASQGLVPKVGSTSEDPATLRNGWFMSDANDGTFKAAMDFDEYMDICEALNIKPLVVVNFLSHYYPGGPTYEELKETAVEWVKYAKTKNIPVEYWQLGNELDLPGNSSDFFGGDNVAAKAAHKAQYLDFAAAMKAEDPTIKVGPGTIEPIYFRSLVEEHPELIDFVSAHNYMDGVAADSRTYEGWKEAEYPYDGIVVKAQTQVVDRYNVPDFEILVTETGVTPAGDTLGRENNVWKGLWWFEVLMNELVVQNVSYIYYWGTHTPWYTIPTVDPNTDVGVLLSADNQTIKPTGMALQFVNQHLLDHFVFADRVSRYVRSYAMMDESRQKVNLLLMNKNNEPEDTLLTFDNRILQNRDYEVKILQGDADTDRSMYVTDPTDTYSVDENGQLLITLPPLSVVALTSEAVDDGTAPAQGVWAEDPQVIDATTAILQAAPGSDDSSAYLEYYFDDISGHAEEMDSEWQTSTLFVARDLEPNTSYTYQILVRDVFGNVGLASNSKVFTTPAGAYAYTVYVDFEDVNDAPGGFYPWNETWNVVPDHDPSEDQALVDYFNEATPLSIGTFSGFSAGSSDEATDFDYSATEWGESAQDSFEAKDAEGRFTLSGFQTSDTVDIYVIAVENNRRDIDVKVNGSFGNGGSGYHDGDAFRTRNDGWAAGTAMRWTGLSGSSSYILTLNPDDTSDSAGDPVISAMKIVVTPGSPAQPDTDAPTPNPATWASVPAAVDDTSITMTATTGSDASGNVYYYFEETSGNNGGSDSGWQSSPTYTDDGLDPETTYTYVFRMSDKIDGSSNVGGDSPSEPATTEATPVSTGYTVQVDFENEDATPTQGGTWNVLDAPADVASLLDSSGSVTSLGIGTWVNMQEGGDSNETNNGFDYSGTEWGASAQDNFVTSSAGVGSFILSGFDSSDTVEIRLIAVESNRRDIDFQVDGAFGPGAHPSDGDNFNSRGDGWGDGVTVIWTGLTGQISYTLTATPTDGDLPVMSAIRIIVTSAASDPDTDGDGLTDSEEVALGTLVDNPDSDGDGLPDGKEVNDLGSDPLSANSSDSGFNDLAYYALDAGSFTTPREALPTLSESGSSFDFHIPKTLATDVDYIIEVSADLVTWYRVAHKLAGSGWQKDTLDDSTPVFSGIDDMTVNPVSDGVTLSDTAPDSQLFYRATARYVSP